MGRLRTVLRWTKRVLLALVVVLVAALLWLQSPAGIPVVRGWLTDLVRGALAPGWTFEDFEIDYGLAGHVLVKHAVLRDPDGRPAVWVGTADLDVDVPRLLIGQLRVERATVQDVVVRLENDRDGVLNLARAFGATEPPVATRWDGLPFTLVVDDLALRDGRIVFVNPGEDGEPTTTLSAKVLDLAAARLRLPRRVPGVELDGLDLAGVLLRPGPLPLLATGGLHISDAAALADALDLRALDTHVTLDGALRDLDGVGGGELKVDLDRVDLGLVKLLTGAPLQGVYAGELTLEGPATALGVHGELRGEGDTDGVVTLGEGTLLCLPMADDAPDRCAVPIGEAAPAVLPRFGKDDPLRWRAELTVKGFDVVDVAPSVKGPLVLDAHVVARGGGTSWPDGLWVDGRLDAGPLRIFPVTLEAIEAGVKLEHGVLAVSGLDATGVVGHATGSGTLDLRDGKLDVDAAGELDLARLEQLGVKDLSGGGPFTAELTGDVFADPVALTIRGEVEAAPVAWADDIKVDAATAPFLVEVVGADVDVTAGVDAREVFLYGVTADRLRGGGITVTVRNEGRLVRLVAARADVSGFDAYGVKTRTGQVTDLSVTIPIDQPVQIDIARATLQGLDAYGILADDAVVDGMDMVAGIDGRFDFATGGVVLGGVDAYGITARQAYTGGLRVATAGPDAPVDVVVEDTRVRDLDAFGIAADRASVPSIDVEAQPSGETDVVLPGADLRDVDVFGVTADRAAMGGQADGLLPPAPPECRDAPDDPLDLPTCEVLDLPSPALATLGRLEVHVEPSGETDVAITEVGLRGVSLYGIEAEFGLVDRVDVHVTPDGDATVKGHAVVDRAVLADADTELTDVEVTFDVAAPAVGDPTIVVDGHTGPHRLFGLDGDHGDADITIVGDLLTGDVSLWRGGEVWALAEDLSLDLVTRALQVGRFELQPSWRQRWASEGPVRLRLLDDGVADAHAVLVSDLGRIELEGTAGLSGPLDAHVAVRGLQLNALAELWPVRLSGLDGVLSADVVASGTAEHPEVRATLSGEDLFWEDTFRWLDVEGDLSVADDVLTTDVRLGVADAPLARVIGTAPLHVDVKTVQLVSRGRADLRVVLDPGSLDRIEHLVPGVDVPEGRASGVLAVRGDLRDPELDLEAVVEAEVAPNEPLRLELDLDRLGDRLDVTADVYRDYLPVLRTTGSARTRIGEIMGWLLGDEPRPVWDDPSLYVDDVALTAELDALPVDLLREVAGLPLDVDGELSGRIALSGDPVRPTLQADVHGPVVLGEATAQLALGLVSADVGYDLQLALGAEDDPWLTAAGRVPLAIDLTTPPDTWAVGTWDVEVGGAGVPLAVLGAVDPGIVDATGRLQLNGRVRGGLLQPRPEVALSLANAGVTLLPIGLHVRDLELQGAIDAQSGERIALRLERISAVTRPVSASLQDLAQAGPSRIEGRGTVVLEGFRPAGVRGELQLSDAWVVALDRSMLRASGDLAVQGRWPELLLTGDVEVSQGRFELNIAELTAPSAIEVDPSITVHRAGVTFRREEVEGEPGVLDLLDVDVDVNLGRNANLLLRVPLLDAFGAFGATVTRADIAARLGGQLQAQMTDGDLSLVGVVETLGGNVSILRGRFDIQQGSTITFYGGDYTNPQLDVRGSMSVSGGQIDLALLGPATSPTFTLNSATWGNDVATLFTILLTGRAPDDLTSNQGRAALEAAGNLLLSSVLGNVSLGSVQVDASGTVRVGIPVYRTVFVETTYNPTARLDQNTITVQLEWSILPKLLVQAAYGNRRVFGNLVYELRLTTLCDRAREVYKLIPDVSEVETVEASCRRIRQRIDAEGGLEAVEARARSRRAAERLRVDPLAPRQGPTTSAPRAPDAPAPDEPEETDAPLP